MISFSSTIYVDLFFLLQLSMQFSSCVTILSVWNERESLLEEMWLSCAQFLFIYSDIFFLAETVPF